MNGPQKPQLIMGAGLGIFPAQPRKNRPKGPAPKGMGLKRALKVAGNVPQWKTWFRD